MPCLPGAKGLRGKKLHCRNHSDGEGWRKDRACARPQGRESPDAQEGGVEAEASESPYLILGFSRPSGDLGMHSSLGATKGQELTRTLSRSQNRVLQWPFSHLSGFFKKVLALEQGQWSSSCGYRITSTSPRREQGREWTAQAKHSIPASPLYDQPNKVEPGSSMRRTS